jgi:predicted enzyme related to lactoylglutathione lyase
MEMIPMALADVPSSWMVDFGEDDIDASCRTALQAGAREMMAPTAFPGGRFAILGDPQGAVFGLQGLSRGQA